ncbi:MAG: hypothetical protein KME22_10235 [Hassallia sp. WJT32-NPBG1]|nr:hypothetical protein [Hassallia sp. WJT32-NPBG1]
MEASNGHTQQPIQDLTMLKIEPTTTAKTRTPRETRNPLIDCSLILDAGSKRIKFLLNGYESTIESIYKQVKGDLPSGMAGCFQYKGKNFVVGKGSESVLGELIEAQRDNKIKKLDVWVLGALTSDSDFLDDVLEDKRNRYKTKPIRLSVDIKLLSLSSNRQGDISKILNTIEGFNYRGRDFTIEFKNLKSEFIYSEGYGAALSAKNSLPDGITSFAVLDLGGGTLTLTSYGIGRRLPKVLSRSVASGGGMQNLASQIFVSLNKTDIGGETKSLNSIFEALKACKRENEEFLVPYRVGGRTENIAESVTDGLSNWIADNPSIADILTKSSQILVSGGSIFATGGGFGSGIIAAKIIEIITSGITSGNCEVLENPHIINVSGMKYL